LVVWDPLEGSVDPVRETLVDGPSRDEVAENVRPAELAGDAVSDLLLR
jgi:hypothetical protein